MLRKSVEKIQVSLKSDKNNWYCTWRPLKLLDHFYTYVIKQTNAYEHDVLSLINYQNVSIAFDTIIRVSLHGYYEYNEMPKSISGATKRYDTYPILSIYGLPRDYCRVLFIWIAELSPFQSVWIRELEILSPERRLTTGTPHTNCIFSDNIAQWAGLSQDVQAH
jgi:hypothetical protein